MLRCLIILIILSFQFKGYGQNIRIEWTVTDTQEPLVGATIQIRDQVLVTNTEGKASLYLPEGKYGYIISFVGYRTVNDTLSVSGQNLHIPVMLAVAYDEIGEVMITDDRIDHNSKHR